MLVTVAEAAEILDVDPATVWRYIKAEDIKPARDSRPYMLWQSDVLAFQKLPKKKPGPKRGSKRRRIVPFRYPLAGEIMTTQRIAEPPTPPDAGG